MQIVIMPHKILSQKDAGIESAPYLWINLICIVHEFL